MLGSYSFMEEGHTRLFDMAFDGRTSGFEELAYGVKLVGDVVSHARVHLGLTIFRLISCPSLSRTRHLLCLGHKK